MNILKAKNIDMHELFVKAEIAVMYHGQNRNHMYIPKDVVEKNINTLANIPIVGKYMKDVKNFDGHNMYLDVTEDGHLKYSRETIPFGVVPESFKWRWEKIVHDDNNVREYLILSDVYIWNRDMDITKDLLNNDYGQSMEITIKDSIMKNNHRHVLDFKFDALCILGIDKNGEGLVTPAFEKAKIALYSHSDETYSDKLNKMWKDFEQFTLNKKGGKILHIEELLKELNMTQEELEEKVPNYSELDLDGIKELLNREAEDAKEDIEQQVEPKDEVEEQSEEFNDTSEESNNEVEVEETETVEETTEKSDVEEVEINNDEESKDSEKIAELEETIVSLNELVSNLQSQVETLEKEKHNRACQDLMDNFTSQYNLDEVLVSEIDFNTVSSTDELESKLFEILGRTLKDVKTKNAKIEEVNKVAFNLDSKEKQTPSYTFEELFNKK